MAELAAKIEPRKAIVEAATIGEKVWKEIFPTEGNPLDLSGADLSGALFTGHLTQLDQADFRGAKLDGSRWSVVTVRRADFTRASLRGCKMVMFGCNGCIFREADLSGATLSGLLIRDGETADFSNANLTGANIELFGQTPMLLTGATLAGCRVSRNRGTGHKGDAEFMKKGIDHFMSLLSAEQKAQLKKSGCFIATAACGAADAEEVRRLQSFRDEVLRRTRIGRLFIAAYESLSPAAAEWIAQSIMRRRVALDLVVRPAATLVSTLRKDRHRYRGET